MIIARGLLGLSTTIVWTSGMAPLHVANIGEPSSQAGYIAAVACLGDLMGSVVGGLLYDASGELGICGFSAALIVIDLSSPRRHFCFGSY